DVQFRYQMEERDGGFVFYCSQECQGKVARGEADGGVTCDACAKRFSVELVSQMVRVGASRKYACSEACRTQVLAEARGAPLGAPPKPAPPPAPAKTAPVTPPPAPVTELRRKIHGPRRLAVFNHKGGTGKTTTTVSVAAGLAAEGLRVLLV